MPASKQLKVLSVRMPEPDLRRFKSVAAARGVNMQEAVHQALEVWASPIRRKPAVSLDKLQGSLAAVDVVALRRLEKEKELAKDKRWS